MVGANTGVASSCEGVSDGFKSVAVNVVSVGGGAGHVALGETKEARTVSKEVGVAKL
jgi:hypothetical protein